MAMSVFYNLLRPNKQAVKTNSNRAKQTESIITQVQKPGTNNLSNTPNMSASPKSLFAMGKCFPTFMANCLTRKRETLLRDENSTDGAYLLGPQSVANKGRKTLVLDLDETLVHSSFDKVKSPDSTLSLMIKGSLYNFSVMIRPGTEEFLAKMSETYEVVIFTASLMEYAKAIMQLINKTDNEYAILAREHCTQHCGVYVKDLTRLGRDLKNVILVDNSPNAFRFQPENAYHIKDFFDDKKDTELYTLQSTLEYIVQQKDVRPVRTHRLVSESKPSTKQTISTETSIKSHRQASTSSISKTEEIITQVKPSAKTARDLKTATPVEAEALKAIRNMIDKKRGTIIKPDMIKTSLLVAKVRTTDVSTAGKSTKDEELDTVDELMVRRPVEDNNDELDARCQTETEFPLMSLGRNIGGSTDSISRSSSSESGSDNDNGEARDTDERIYYAVEARAC